MKKNTLWLSALIIGVAMTPLITLAAGGNGGAGQRGQGGGGGGEMMVNVNQWPMEALSDAEAEGLKYMLEEEKLARDVYRTLYETYPLNVFNNIPQSEEKHIEAVRTLAERYDLAYEGANNDNIGVFLNPEIQALYDDLVAQGLASELAALQVGATIEDLDIYDLNEFLTEVDNQDIRQVFEYLIMGSENHLRAFNRQLERRGAPSYQAQYISQAAVDEILGSVSGHQAEEWATEALEVEAEVLTVVEVEKAVLSTPDDAVAVVQTERADEAVAAPDRGFWARFLRFFGWNR